MSRSPWAWTKSGCRASCRRCLFAQCPWLGGHGRDADAGLEPGDGAGEGRQQAPRDLSTFNHARITHRRRRPPPIQKFTFLINATTCPTVTADAVDARHRLLGLSRVKCRAGAAAPPDHGRLLTGPGRWAVWPAHPRRRGPFPGRAWPAARRDRRSVHLGGPGVSRAGAAPRRWVCSRQIAPGPRASAQTGRRRLLAGPGRWTLWPSHATRRAPFPTRSPSGDRRSRRAPDAPSPADHAGPPTPPSVAPPGFAAPRRTPSLAPGPCAPTGGCAKHPESRGPAPEWAQARSAFATSRADPRARVPGDRSAASDDTAPPSAPRTPPGAGRACIGGRIGRRGGDERRLVTGGSRRRGSAQARADAG